jgi:putative transposase
MTETLVGVNPPSSKDPADPPSAEELAAAKELVRQASAQGVALTGPGGLLKALTKTVLETRGPRPRPLGRRAPSLIMSRNRFA